jgi:hypothetical protein
MVQQCRMIEWRCDGYPVHLPSRLVGYKHTPQQTNEFLEFQFFFLFFLLLLL